MYRRQKRHFIFDLIKWSLVAIAIMFFRHAINRTILILALSYLQEIASKLR